MRNSSKRRPSQIAELLRSGGGVRAVKHILCAALFAAAAVAQSSTSYRIDTVAARLAYPLGVAADGAGNVYIADSDNHRIRKVDSAGVISTIAGSGETGIYRGGFSGDGGPATSARLSSPSGVALDGAGNLFIADTYNRRIRKVDSAGVISTVAGTGEFTFGGGDRGDGGPAVDAQLATPSGMALDGAGNLFIADTYDHRIRKVDSAGVISTIAGSGETGVFGDGGFSGDGGPAVEAELYNPVSVALDGAGNLFIADRYNHRIRKVDSAGVISTVAGSGEAGVLGGGFSGDGGPATAARLSSPSGVALDGAGNLFIADKGNHRIRKVDAAGTISTIAGSGETGIYRGGFSGDGGPATSARLSSPSGVALDGAGDLFIADTGNDLVRKLTPVGPAATPTYYFPHLAVGASWQTTITYINYSPEEVTCQTDFISDHGSPLMVSFAELGTVDSRTDVLPPGGSVHQETDVER